MTVAECIAAYEQLRVRPVRTTALTPRGRAVVAARQLARAVADLDDPEDRIDMLSLAMSEALRLLTEPQVA